MNQYRDIVSQQNNRLANLIQQSKEAKFLIKPMSLNSFQLIGQDKKSFKVSIGSQLFCTCSLVSRHCIHTIYVLINCYRVSAESDFFRAQNYNNIDIVRKNDQNLNCFVNLFSEKQSTRQQSPQLQIQKSLQHSIHYDEVCAICQQELEMLPIHFCKESCGTNFHAQCLYDWVIYKKSRTCPTCRKQWPNTVVRELKQTKNTILLHKDYQCQICQITPIKGYIYVCPQCPNWGICQNCYFKCKTHQQNHKIYLTRQTVIEVWQWTRDEIELIFNLLVNPLVLEDQRMIDSIQNNQSVKMLLLGKTIKSPHAQNYIKCDFCKQLGECKQLNCGHIIDRQCLMKLMNDSLKCTICEQKLFDLPKGQIKAQEFKMTKQKIFSISKPNMLKLNLKSKMFRRNLSSLNI